MSHGSLCGGARDGRRGVQLGARSNSGRAARIRCVSAPSATRASSRSRRRGSASRPSTRSSPRSCRSRSRRVEAGRRRTKATRSPRRSRPPHAAGDRPDLAAAAHDIYSIEDLAQLIFDLRQVNPDAAVSGEARRRGGRGMVAPASSKRSPTSSTSPAPTAAPAPARSRRSRTQVHRGSSGSWRRSERSSSKGCATRAFPRRRRPQDRTRRDRRRAARRRRGFVRHRAAARAGCLMVRSCHLDTCPVGIATQRPELRAKFAASPEDVTDLRFVSQEVRVHLASLGLHVRRGRGRSRACPPGRACGRDTAARAGGSRLRRRGTARGARRRAERLAADAAAILEETRLLDLRYPISTSDRPCSARRRDRIPFRRRRPAGPRACWLRRLGRPELRRVPDHRDQARSTARRTTTSASR